MKTLLKTIASVILLWCLTGVPSIAENGPEIRITGQGLKVAAFNATATERGNSVFCTTNNYLGGFSLAGNWDLCDYNRISFVVQNLDEESMIQLILHIQDVAKPLEKSSSKGTMSRVFVVDPGATKEFVFDLPAELPHPEIQTKFKRMKRGPYFLGYGMAACEVDWSGITRVKFFTEHGKLSSKFVVSDLKFLHGARSLPAAWMSMSEQEFFPFIDKYGQFKHGEWKDKIHSDEDFQKQKDIEVQDLTAHPGPSDRTKFGGWKNGPQYEATGHFRVEKIDGKWWFIDPEGYLWWSHGVVRVTPSSAVTPLDGRDFYFESLPQAGDVFNQFYFTHDKLLKPYYDARKVKATYDFSSANLYRKYGEDYKTAFAELAHKRLKSWGLNTIANSSDRDICMMDETPYIERIEINRSPVLHGSGGHWWSFRDPFDPGFADEIRRKLTEVKPQLDDPWCVGYFVDNELKWGNQTYLARCTVKAPAEQEAKKAMVQYFKKIYKKINKLNDVWGTNFSDWEGLLHNRSNMPKAANKDLKAFNEQIIRKYFSTIRDIFKEIAPNKLYMGCRFAGANDLVVKIGSEYCDIMSWNSYRMDLSDFMCYAYSYLDKPIIIGEFHFGAVDRGKFHHTLIRVNDQEQRGRAYYNYVKSALEHPLVVGTHWHQFADQATTGRFDGENFQVGFTDMCDTPYYETIEKIREIGQEMYEVRLNSTKTRK